MRTTVRLDDHLLARAKELAAQNGQSLTAVIEDALHELLARKNANRPRERKIVLPTFKGKGLRPGVDLDNSAALLELMERNDD